MDTPEMPGTSPVPKKYCMITLMFPIQEDKEALDVKIALDVVLQDKPDKRFTFQIVER